MQSYVKQPKAQNTTKTPESKQLEEHNHNVVMLLQSKLADTSMTFKDVLEIRTQARKVVHTIQYPLTLSLEHEGIQRSYRTVHALDVRSNKPSTLKYVV